MNIIATNYYKTLRWSMKYRKKTDKSHCVIFLFVISVFMIILISLLKIEKSIRPIAELQSEHIAQKTAIQIIDKTVSDYLETNKFTYSDFAAVLYDDEKRVAAIEVIPYNINKVQSELGELININLEKQSKNTTEIPLGSLTNSHILTGKGPKISIKVSPVGSAQIKLKNDFVSAGVNQTCHRISALISVKMTSSVPLYSFETNAELEFIITENVIVGSVPDLTPYTVSDKNNIIQ